MKLPGPKKEVLKFILKVLLITVLVTGFFYLFVVLPSIKKLKEIKTTQASLVKHYSLLMQNRVAYIGLTKLNTGSYDFNLRKSEIIDKIRKSSKEGTDLINAQGEVPNVNKDLEKRFDSLLNETKEVYSQQEQFLNKVFETKSYESGVALIKSDEGLQVLTKQTNLVIEYQYWVNELDSTIKRTSWGWRSWW